MIIYNTGDCIFYIDDMIIIKTYNDVFWIYKNEILVFSGKITIAQKIINGLVFEIKRTCKIFSDELMKHTKRLNISS